MSSMDSYHLRYCSLVNLSFFSIAAFAVAIRFKVTKITEITIEKSILPSFYLPLSYRAFSWTSEVKQHRKSPKKNFTLKEISYIYPERGMKLSYQPFRLDFRHPFGLSSHSRKETPVVFTRLEENGL